MSKLYIITGPPGSGKTTISEEIAKKLSKSVLIEGDTIYNQFVGGRIKPWYPEAPLELFWKNCIYLINSYLEEGYDVVFNYIIKQEQYEKLQNIFKNYNIIFKVLITDEKTIIKRDKNRPEDCQMGNRSVELLKEFKEDNYKEKNILDTSNLSIKETVELILKKGETNEDRNIKKRRYHII